jgi:thiamine biosynthesis protein ThiS
MKIRLNGKDHEAGEGFTVLQLLQSLNIQSEVVAVELNEVIVKRDERASAVLKAGDQVEVIRMIGGGSRG